MTDRIRKRKITAQLSKASVAFLEDEINSCNEETPEEKLKAIWEITLMAYFLKGQDFYASRFPRSIATFERFPS